MRICTVSVNYQKKTLLQMQVVSLWPNKRRVRCIQTMRTSALPSTACIAAGPARCKYVEKLAQSVGLIVNRLAH